MLKEIQEYLTVLNELRSQVQKQMEGLSPEALDWQPIRGAGELATNSLAVMAAHLAGSEAFWIKEIVARQPIQRNRDAEFATQGVSALELQARLVAAAKNTEEILPLLKEGQLAEERKVRDRSVTVRWSILHVIEHTAQHLGHMQLTRQLWRARSRE
jgi:uncharacterized damage-inducible protein DinB